MQQTANYNLNKPEAADQYNIEHFNDNADIIDTQMKTNADNIAALDNAAMKKASNLSDLVNKSTAMTNVMDSFTSASDGNVNSDNIEFMGRKTSGSTKTWYKIKFSSFWNYIKNKVSSWFGLTVTESGESITGRSFDGNSSTASNASTADKVSHTLTLSFSDNTSITFDGSNDKNVSLKKNEIYDNVYDLTSAIGSNNAIDTNISSDINCVYAICVRTVIDGSYLVVGNLIVDILSNQKFNYSVNCFYSRYNYYVKIVVNFSTSTIKLYTPASNILNKSNVRVMIEKISI